ncbi:SigE family RNA polymerase sigma factor [Catellatospora paridis]|uniref:SigE family RNA polymerase sigma factor n=1 Tax=Catellatospora paridis TaxID=1617086 RepID=UPI0012D3DDE9|nr:SigE family RNA polymerase sigma factor [Catellatospora paridis]
MAGTAEFDEFVTMRSRHLLRIAYLLTGDHALAEDLLQTALARSWSAWRRIHGNPEPYVRRVLANTYNSWWRRRWHGERPTETLPERPAPSPHTAVDDRDEVWRALSKLPRQQKLVLVLRYFEDLSEAEIAQTLGISPGSVKTHTSRALASLRLDPGLRTLPLPADDDVPAGNERLTAVRGRITQRRRNRIAAAFLALASATAGYLLAAPAVPYDVADFPEFDDGQHIVLRGQATFGDAPAGFRWTPTKLDGKVQVACAHTEKELSLYVSVLINGKKIYGTGCDTDGEIGFSGSARLTETSLRSAGVSIGRPATVTLIVEEPSTFLEDPAPSGPYAAPGGTVPADGVMVVVLGESVPFDEYPLPARPDELETLSRPSSAWLVGSVLVEAAGPHTVTMPWRGGPLQVAGLSQTPGIMRIKVNGRLVDTKTWWNYTLVERIAEVSAESLAELGVDPLLNEPVTITVETEHMTGDWWLRVSPPS